MYFIEKKVLKQWQYILKLGTCIIDVEDISYGTLGTVIHIRHFWETGQE